MTRKRFYKLVMSAGYNRNDAQKITAYARKRGLNINPKWKFMSIGCIRVGMVFDDIVNETQRAIDSFLSDLEV